ncbi:CBS domain-containing protein [Methanolobus profundi]|uniref:CBS domain-containing protein n=1 Tax=Methanolobus profundi TaxID=487685 RepID=A0A1I4T914_9EURY|nr:CBS domain-containing protein [Methanolobus profundi]SFM73057.1 CBS domain-containing protein [Methanolobus profundi]
MVLSIQNDMQADVSILEIQNEMLVRETMSKDIFGIDITSSVLEVARTMMENDTGSIIVKEDGDSTGIITEHDVIAKTVVKNVLPSEMTAREIMSSPIIAIKPSTSIIEAAEMMVRSNIRRLAVMEGDSIVGMITDRDIIAIAPGLTTILEELIELHHENNIQQETELERGICQSCGKLVDSPMNVNGLMLCEDCKEEEGYYD